jgi:hypothetical protein
MKLSDVVENIHVCKKYDVLLDGIYFMIKKSPDSDKKEMLLDIINLGKDITKRFTLFAGSNEYLQALNFKEEGLRLIAERRVKELEIELENFKRGL